MTLLIVIIKTTSKENDSTGVLDKNKEHYLRCEIKPKYHMMYKDIYNGICQNKNKMKINSPLCQTYSPTVV